jgi:hypothetical protein
LKPAKLNFKLAPGPPAGIEISKELDSIDKPFDARGTTPGY